MNSLDYLNICTNPFPTAKVYNPTRPEYYLKDPLAAAAKAEAEKAAAAEKTQADKPTADAKQQPQQAQTPQPQAPQPAVKITLSDEAKAAMKKE